MAQGPSPHLQAIANESLRAQTALLSVRGFSLKKFRGALHCGRARGAAALDFCEQAVYGGHDVSGPHC